MRHNNTKKLFSYWNALRGSRIAPDREEIEPSDIRDLLGETFILESDPVYGNISFRLAGTRLCDLYGGELKGLGFLSLWREEDNMEMYSLSREVIYKTKPYLISYMHCTDDGKEREFEMVLLPLMNGQHKAFRALGAAFAIDPPSPGVAHAFRENTIRNTRKIQVKQHVPVNVEVFQPENIEPLQMPTGRKIGHLTVIEGGAPT